MPSISPLGTRLTKDSLNDYCISATYHDLPQEPDFFECHIEIASTGSTSPANGSANGDKPANPEKKGWLQGLFSLENVNLVETEPDEIPLLLGYVQLIGYIRLNCLVGSEGSNNAASNPFWKNLDYINLYGKEDLDGQIETIKKTPFLKKYSGDQAAKQRSAGVADLNAKTFDDRTQYLVHDLVYQFNSLSDVPDNAEHHGEELAREITHSIVPFYVTAQLLLFSSSRVKLGELEKCILKVPKPPNELPPSYNTKLTGAAGDAGLVSIEYALVVGVSEEEDGQLSPRNVYFPLEFRLGKRGWDREWLQPDYLQEPIVDKKWKTELRENGRTQQAVPKDSKEKMLRDIDTLIESDVQVVAANERRKSSVSKSLTEYMGLVSQLPTKPRVSYQIRVNSVGLCTLTMSKPFYHIGDEIHFFLDIDRHDEDGAHIVGYHAHIEAHEVFNLENNQNFTNSYKVTPSVKQNLFATALAANWDAEADPVTVSSVISLPRHISQQFQSSLFMDLRYCFVCKFLLNEFTKPKINEEQATQKYADYIQEYRVDNEGTEFKFAIPLTVLP